MRQNNQRNTIKHTKIIFEQLSFYSDTKMNRSPYNESEKEKECALQTKEKRFNKADLFLLIIVVWRDPNA